MTPSNDFAIVNLRQNLRHIFSIFHLSECVIERITLSHIQGCISRRFHFDELQNNKRINLSRFRKKDRLIPIISLVFYYSSEPWDGPVDLYDMFQLEGTKEENEILEKYLPNYKINLVDAERLEDVEKFSDDLQVILTMLRYRDSKEELTDYINENKKFFQNVDYETSQAMKAFLNMKQIPGEAEHKEEMIDMCKAIQEMYDDGVKDGIQQGVEQGRTELLKEQIQRKLKKEKTPTQIAEELEESVEVIEKIIKEMQ
ncbi:MAG: Rpn family recombination-promoting nuclease/putative transposase [Mediterraneibacter faecis]